VLYMKDRQNRPVRHVLELGGTITRIGPSGPYIAILRYFINQLTGIRYKTD